MTQELIEQKFRVDGQAKLKIGNIRGSTKILAGQDGEISIRAAKQAGSGDLEGTEIRIYQAEGGTVKVETHFYHDLLSFFGHFPCKVDYIVQVPRHCNVRTSGVSSSTSVDGLEGDLDLNTISGRVNLADLIGSFKISSVSGEVFGDRLTGSLSLDSVSGNILLSDSLLSCAKATTVSGGLRLETPIQEGPYLFDSVSGSVNLLVPVSTACTLHFNSVSSSLSVSLPVTRSEGTRHHKTMDIQGGGTEILLKSVSGSVLLAPKPDQAEVKPTVLEAKLSTIEVLRKIELGELSVTKGIELLG
jgi:hypothetical protein